MNIDEFLTLNLEARPYGRGYRGPCPSCGGNSQTKFSIAERDGKIMVHCFAGCSTEAICQSLGIELKDLFVDSDLTPSQRQALPPRPKRFDWRRFANAVQHLSNIFFLRSERILRTAQGLNPSEWEEADLDQAMAIIAKAQYLREQSECLADLAVAYRAKHLTEDQNNAHRRSKVA